MHLIVFEMPEPVDKIIARETKRLADIQKKESQESQGENEDATTVVSKSIELHDAPSLRIVGYDPRSKHRTIIIIPPNAVAEVSGGYYSAYLEEERRRELARIVCDKLELTFPKNKPFELMLPWTGSSAVSTGSKVQEGKVSWRSNADRINARTGKLFRSAVKVSHLDLIVSIFALLKKSDLTNIDERCLVVNFYAPAASEAVETVLSEKVQVEYCGRAILDFNEGEPRSIAIRNLCKNFSAELLEDPDDSDKKVLMVQLKAKKKAFIDDYKNIGLPPPELDKRAMGVPVVFMPPATTGKLLSRQSVCLYCKETKKLTDKQYIVSLSTKAQLSGAETGLVVRAYDQAASETIVLHYSARELIRLCEEVDQPDLLRDYVTVRDMVFDGPKDLLEEDFVSITEKGEILVKIQNLIGVITSIIIKDLGISKNSMDENCLYSLTSEYVPA